MDGLMCTSRACQLPHSVVIVMLYSTVATKSASTSIYVRVRSLDNVLVMPTVLVSQVPLDRLVLVIIIKVLHILRI